MKNLFYGPQETVAVNTKNLTDLFNIYATEAYELKQEIARQQKELDCLMDKLKNLAHGSSVVSDAYAFTFVWRQGDVDYKAIPELQSVDLDSYRKGAHKAWSLTKLGI